MDFNKPQKRNKDQNNKNNKKEEKRVIESKEIYFTYSDDMSEQDYEYYDYTLELPLFPDDFEEYKGEKSISNEKINDWIAECIILLESDNSETYATAQAGDTKIVVLRIYDDADNYHYIIEVFKDRYTIEIYPEEL